MANCLKLSDRLDSASAERLRADLARSEGEDLVLDASAVTFLGGMCVELLMCAAGVWAKAGKTLSLDAPSEAFVEDLARFGLVPDQLRAGGSNG